MNGESSIHFFLMGSSVAGPLSIPATNGGGAVLSCTTLWTTASMLCNDEVPTRIDLRLEDSTGVVQAYVGSCYSLDRRHIARRLHTWKCGLLHLFRLGIGPVDILT